MSPDDMSAWHSVVVDLLRTSRNAQPSVLADVVNKAVRPLGIEVTIYLVDREQVAMRALPRAGEPIPEPLTIDATLGGRAFSSLEPVVAPGQSERIWIPLVDDAERLGVIEVRLPDGVSPDDAVLRDGLALLAYEVGHLLVAKIAYGDTIRRTRRSRPMSTEGEMLWRTLPPLTFSTREVTLAAALEPCYDVGGDAFDYAIDYENLRIAVLDAVGHGLTAVLTSTLTLAAIRAARAGGLGLPATAAAADRAITSQFDDLRYTTAILAELDTTTGTLRYVNAGHPPAVLIREGKVVTALDAVPRTPLGLAEPADVAEQSLQPNDRVLFYTDGIIEARDSGGDFFGVERLVEQVERHTVSGLPIAETLRRLAHDVLRHQEGPLGDDATLVIVEWHPPGA